MLGAIYKGFPHIWGRGGGGSGKSGQMQTGGEGWLAKCGFPLGKKIMATIFVKFTQILKNLHFFFGQSCLCFTFTSWSTPSFQMLLSKLSNRNTHVCTSSIRMNCFLLCELFTSCNVSDNASLVSARTGREGVVNQIWTGLGRGRGDPQNSQICADILYG